ncbi:hypothetical protein PVAND_013965 [Polypedilum vanderplanki]|uniref:Uncharacterized protein n=1 Tax=Polypedilum vanderplanki TaxID=319348 RepID=A0A9J6CSB3_POLVA|nr:hypothetical protein PVAND_013965 [Polypedilum vanderplanki]
MAKLITFSIHFLLIISCTFVQSESTESKEDVKQDEEYDENYFDVEMDDDAEYNMVKYGIRARSRLDPEDKDAMLDVFLHNFMNKLERAVKVIDNKKITEKFNEISKEYYSRLAEDTIRTDEGFNMGDSTLHLLKVANLVLDSADIREMKKMGMLKKALEKQIMKQREELGVGGKGPSYFLTNELETPNVQPQMQPQPQLPSILNGLPYSKKSFMDYDDTSVDTNGKGFRRLEDLREDDMGSIYIKMKNPDRRIIPEDFTVDVV